MSGSAASSRGRISDRGGCISGALHLLCRWLPQRILILRSGAFAASRRMAASSVGCLHPRDRATSARAFSEDGRCALLIMRRKETPDDHALSLPCRALVPAGVDAGRDGACLRAENAAVPAAGVRQGIPRDQSARHHSVHDRRRNQNDGVLRHLPLSRHPARPDAAGGRRRRSGLWRVPELDVFQRRDADLSADAGAPLRPARARGTAQSAGRRRLRQMVFGPAAGGRGRHRPMRRRWSPAASPRPIS